MKIQQTFYRQGDVGIESISTFPKGIKPKKDNILVHSDSTMHDHTLKTGKVYTDKNGDLFMDVPQNTQVIHTMDHKPINLPKGKYKIIRQREISMGDMTKIVVD